MALAAGEITAKEAATLEAIARGENPCARIGEENTAITGTRRRLVTELRKKGLVAPVDIAPSEVPAPSLAEVIARMPRLTDAGRRFLAGRSDTEPPPPSGSEIDDWQAGGAL